MRKHAKVHDVRAVGLAYTPDKSLDVIVEEGQEEKESELSYSCSMENDVWEKSNGQIQQQGDQREN